jgi:transcriptional regulator with XRE-family HTH domain
MTMNQSSPAELTPKLVKAARALLAWSQQDLAKEANVATSTVADFERGQRTPVANNAQAIRGALEKADIHFLPTGAIIGPPVPGVVAPQRPGLPVRWVTAQDLSQWADRKDGAASLPTLLAFLIRATQGPNVQLRFPSDESILRSGWDGRTKTAFESLYVPQGDTAWEFGAQRTKIPQKASDDYTKRTEKPGPLNPADTTFVFVTPRRWPQKETWAKERSEEGVWKAVKVYDADDLVHWIELTPAVGLWLASRLNNRPAETREVESIWEEWSLATQWPLTEDLVLSDRDQDAVEVLRWLRGKPAVLSLQATTTDEVVAFFHATVAMLPDDVAATYQARSLVATSAAGARALLEASGPLIILMTEPDPGLAKALVKRDHHVLQAYDARLVAQGELRTLARPSREGIASALQAAGIAEPRAKALARDCARNLTVLRRLIPSASGRVPQWAEVAPPQALIAALLAGGWDENVAADRARLAELADQSYDTIVANLKGFVGGFDRPLQKIGSTWRVASPFDAWMLLAQYLTGSDIARFEAAAHSVLSSVDPRFELDPDERWMAALKGVNRDYSGMIRHGIGQVLILLAIWGNQVSLVPNAGNRAAAIVKRLLGEADSQLWWSLTRDFRLLAEASPDAFLTAVEDSLDQNDPAIGVLFGTEEGGPFGAEHLSDLLWALEMLAWSPDLLPRVTHVLARLDAMDNPPGRYMNRPANSLRQIYLFWLPQTYASLDERLKAIDLIRRRESNPAWRLMLGLLPRGHDTSGYSPMPRWRDFSVDRIETVTWAVISRGAAEITNRLLEDVGLNPVRWSLLLDRFADLAPAPTVGLPVLDAAEPRITDRKDRLAIWNELRRVLHHHRQFPDADWSMAKEVLDRLSVAYERFAPTDLLERNAWLFASSVAHPSPSSEGWEAEGRHVDAARREAAASLFASGGIPTVLALARIAELPGYIGAALYGEGLSEGDFDALLEASLRSDDARERDVGHGLINSAFRDRSEAWAAGLIERAMKGHWGDTAVLTILRALPVQSATWTHAANAGAEIERQYWLRAPIYWMSTDSAEVSFAIRKLISVGRARHALPLGSPASRVTLPSDMLVELLNATADQPFESSGDSNEVVMFQHHLAEILEVLDQREDVDRNTLVALEWKFLPVLTHSRRPAKLLLEALSESPGLFIQMLSAVFKPKEDSGVVDKEPANPEMARAVAYQAFQLLEAWDHLPGTREDGTVDGPILMQWVKDARLLAGEVGRAEVADSRIGQMLSASQFGADGNWPAEPVRQVLEEYHSKTLIEGFQVGKRNRRGVTSRLLKAGGNLERAEVANYRKWGAAIALEHPRTGKALIGIAESYEAQAQEHDDDSERLDWED